MNSPTEGCRFVYSLVSKVLKWQNRKQCAHWRLLWEILEKDLKPVDFVCLPQDPSSVCEWTGLRPSALTEENLCSFLSSESRPFPSLVAPWAKMKPNFRSLKMSSCLLLLQWKRAAASDSAFAPFGQSWQCQEVKELPVSRLLDYKTSLQVLVL